jgi:hypothetical protein
MHHFLAKASRVTLIALASISTTAPIAAAATSDRPAVVDVQYRPTSGCSPVQAVQKARWAGLRNARLTSITPRRAIVSGRRYRGWQQMTFANVRGCPLIRH